VRAAISDFEGFFDSGEKVVNRQKLHDWGYVVGSKGKIVVIISLTHQTIPAIKVA
jgi:hypothetical protein